MRFTLNTPLMITSRLLPGVKVGDSFISIEVLSHDGAGRYKVGYFLDGPTGMLGSGDEISVMMMAHESVSYDLPRKAMATLLSLLGNDGDGYRQYMGNGEPIDGYAFGPVLAEFAYMHGDEISMIACDLDDSE